MVKGELYCSYPTPHSPICLLPHLLTFFSFSFSLFLFPVGHNYAACITGIVLAYVQKTTKQCHFHSMDIFSSHGTLLVFAYCCKKSNCISLLSLLLIVVLGYDLSSCCNNNLLIFENMVEVLSVMYLNNTRNTTCHTLPKHIMGSLNI
jgi:hypothetical protein